MTILVTGGTGLLGPYLIEAAPAGESVTITARTGTALNCDLTNEDDVARLVEKVAPSTVIHCAAATDVDWCERNPDAADRINHRATAFLAAQLPDDAELVYVSTDQVYPDVPGPHTEGSEAPVNIYGRSKLRGEEAALRHSRALVLRSNIIGSSRTPGRSSLSDWVCESLTAGKPITLFNDIRFSPLSMSTLGKVVYTSLQRGLRGVFNAGSRDGMSKEAFGRAVAAHYGLSDEPAASGVSRAHPGRAPRISDMRLDVSRLEAALEQNMPRLMEEISTL